MKKIEAIIVAAKLKQQELSKAYLDRRFKNVIGKLIDLNLIENDKFTPYRGKISLDDALWAGGFEPRILELLPALFIKKPKTFLIQKNIPLDFLDVVSEIKHNRSETNFRGVAPKDYMHWIDFVGRKGTKPNLIKSYRFNTNDLDLIQKLKNKYNISETELIRRSLLLLSKC
jgi:hypothetical protein